MAKYVSFGGCGGQGGYFEHCLVVIARYSFSGICICPSQLAVSNGSWRGRIGLPKLTLRHQDNIRLREVAGDDDDDDLESSSDVVGSRRASDGERF